MTREFHLIFSSLCPELASVVAVGPDGVLPQGECQMSDDTSDVGRISNQSTLVQTVQT